MKVWVKFLKDHDTYKSGDVVEVEEEISKSLVSLKMAETTESPSDEIIGKALGGLSDTIEKGIEKAVETAMKNVNEAVKHRFPAVARDHDEESRRGFKSLGEFAIAVHAAGPAGIANSNCDPRLKGTPSGHAVQSDEAGGFLVPELFSREIWEFVNGEESYMSRTDRRSTSSDNLNINGLHEVSRKEGAGLRHGGMIAYWMDEADQYTASQIKFRRIRLQLHKLGVLTYVTDEELADANVALGPILARKAADAINFKVNEAILWGTGAGQPLGILRSPALITVDPEASQDNSIRHKNLNKMYFRLHPGLLNGAVWFMHRTVESQLSFINWKDDTAAGSIFPLYVPAGGISGRPFSTLYGLPIIRSEFMRGIGAKGDILLANLGQYATLTKAGGGISSASSMHLRFLYDEQAFKWSFRVDGQPMWSTPLTEYNGNETTGPFVTLGTRTGGATSSGL